jgi:hypothetical protein
MILTDKVYVKINESNYEYYSELKFLTMEPSIGEVIIVPPALLSTGSHYKITCKCDNCGIEKDIMYKNYLKYKHEKWGDYNCRQCSEDRRKKALKKSIGVEYPIQNSDIKQKIKDTLIKKYGVDSPKKAKKP